MVKFSISILFFFVLTLVLITLINAAPQNDPPPRPNDLKPGNHYFTADWCSACQEQSIIIKQLQDQGYSIITYKQEENPKIFKNFNIKKIPMLIVVRIDEKGRRIYTRLVGVQPIQKLVKILVKEHKIDIKIGNIEIKVD